MVKQAYGSTKRALDIFVQKSRKGLHPSDQWITLAKARANVQHRAETSFTGFYNHFPIWRTLTMKKSLFTTGCCVAALMSATSVNADVILTNSGGVVTNLGFGDFEGTNGQLRNESLQITAANGGGTFTLLNEGSNNIITQNTTTTIDIEAGSLIVERNTFLGNDGAGNLTFNLSGGVAQFDDNVGIGRDEATTLVTISGGSFNVDGVLSFDVPGGSGGVRPGFGTIDFTDGSTGSLTVAGLGEADFAAFVASGDITFDGAAVAAADFGTTFSVSGSTLSVVPEPASLALVGLGALAMAGRRRRA